MPLLALWFGPVPFENYAALGHLTSILSLVHPSGREEYPGNKQPGYTPQHNSSFPLSNFEEAYNAIVQSAIPNNSDLQTNTVALCYGEHRRVENKVLLSARPLRSVKEHFIPKAQSDNNEGVDGDGDNGNDGNGGDRGDIGDAEKEDVSHDATEAAREKSVNAESAGKDKQLTAANGGKNAEKAHAPTGPSIHDDDGRSRAMDLFKDTQLMEANIITAQEPPSVEHGRQDDASLATFADSAIFNSPQAEPSPSPVMTNTLHHAATPTTPPDTTPTPTHTASRKRSHLDDYGNERPTKKPCVEATDAGDEALISACSSDSRDFLDQTKWLTASNLMAVLSLLGSVNPGALIVDPALFCEGQLIPSGDLLNFTRNEATRSHPRLSMILLCINVKSHWAFVSIDMTQKRMELANSLVDPNYDDRFKAAANIFLETILLSSPPSTTNGQGSTSENQWQWHAIKPSPQQTDNVNCGVFSLVFAWHVALGLSLPDTVDAPIWRAFFSDLLHKAITVDSPSGAAGSSAARAEPMPWQILALGQKSDPLTLPQVHSTNSSINDVRGPSGSSPSFAGSWEATVGQQQKAMAHGSTRSVLALARRQVTFYGTRLQELKDHQGAIDSIRRVVVKSRDRLEEVSEELQTLRASASDERTKRTNLVSCYEALGMLSDSATATLFRPIEQFEKEAYKVAVGNAQSARRIHMYWERMVQFRDSLDRSLRALDVLLGTTIVDLESRIEANSTLVMRAKPIVRQADELQKLIDGFSKGIDDAPTQTA